MPQLLKKAKPKKRKQPSVAALREKAAVLLQKLVRMKAADPLGHCGCVTCGKIAHWKEMQGGHFIERGKAATKLVEENVHPQCPYCNQWGMKQTTTVLKYRDYMVAMYGEKFVAELEQQARQVCKQSRSEIEAIADDFAERIKQQGKRLGSFA